MNVWGEAEKAKSRFGKRIGSYGSKLKAFCQLTLKTLQILKQDYVFFWKKTADSLSYKWNV